MELQSVSDQVHQLELALLFDRQDVDESFVEHSSLWQFGDDPCGQLAAWCWDIDLLGEPDVALLQSKQSLVASHTHLQNTRWKFTFDPETS